MKWWNEATDNWGIIIITMGYILMLAVGLLAGFIFGFSKGFF